jgi:signal transduction histidine kinase
VKGGLTRRMVVASGLLTLLIAAAFVILLLSIADLRDSAHRARHSEEVLAAVNELERLVIDLETGQRGFVITGDERFLQPWDAARSSFSKRAETVERLVADNPDQQRLVRQIAESGESYIRDYSIPLVDAARRGEPFAKSVEATAEGKRRVDAMRALFDRFVAAERVLSAAREEGSAVAAGRAIVAGAGGLMGSILLVLLFSGYLTREIVWPVRRASLMAGRLAGGDLGARMPESSAGEIGALERSFNTMAGSLEESRDELARLADEQAALRRVATLVAKGSRTEDVFAAVAEEVGRLLHVDVVHMVQYVPDGTVVIGASWREHGETWPVGTRWGLEGLNISAMIFRTERPARIHDYADASGEIAANVRRLGIRSSVGGPIVVNGRLWGAMIASSRQPEPLSSDTESHIAAFTELVATAISNAQARAELAASRARIVAASDETRRWIERDLHDGIQQRLVSLGLELRAAELTVPPELGEVKEQMSQVVEGLEASLEDLREISRGIHPAILSEGGLGPAIKVLARRSTVPIELGVRTEGRWPEQIEVAAYFVVSEALANATKHAKATTAHIDLDARDDVLYLSVTDDGVGGADLSRGSGLIGLTDRVEALGGSITIASPIGEGTAVVVQLPLGGD